MTELGFEPRVVQVQRLCTLCSTTQDISGMQTGMREEEGLRRTLPAVIQFRGGAGEAAGTTRLLGKTLGDSSLHHPASIEEPLPRYHTSLPRSHWTDRPTLTHRVDFLTKFKVNPPGTQPNPTPQEARVWSARGFRPPSTATSMAL